MGDDRKPVRLLVTGGRDFADRELAFEALDRVLQRHGVEVVVHGGASGADTIAGEWAQERGIAVEVFKPDWRLGKGAGPKRNAEMIVKGRPTYAVALPGGKGTEDMYRRLVAAKVFVVRVPPRKA